MEPITLIMTALAFGATEMAKGALAEPGKEMYQGLKAQILRLFAGDTQAENVLKYHEANPKSFEMPLKDELAKARVDLDAEVLAKAKAFLEAVDPAGSAKGHYTVIASGERSFAIGGSASNNTIITGDNTGQIPDKSTGK